MMGPIFIFLLVLFFILDKFLDRIEKKFGSEVVIGWGNWSRNGGMRGCVPSLGKGLRRKVEKKFMTVTVDEYMTSKKCHWCKRELKNKKVEHGKKGKSLYRCLICDKCPGREGNREVHRHINRDINGGLNIRECLSEWIYHQRRPNGLQRVSSLDKGLALSSPPSAKKRLSKISVKGKKLVQSGAR